MPSLLRIAVIGPESTGKTTLCRNLAEHYHTNWVPEFARDFILNLNRPYTKDDVLYCAEKQIEAEKNAYSQSNKILFCDTELIIFKIWLLDVYGDYPKWIDEKIDEMKYDLYLLTSPDILFIEDPVRENGQRRQFFFDWYRSELEKRKFSYEIIEGEERMKKAISLLENHFTVLRNS